MPLSQRGSEIKSEAALFSVMTAESIMLLWLMAICRDPEHQLTSGMSLKILPEEKEDVRKELSIMWRRLDLNNYI